MSVCKILKTKPKMRPYKIQYVQELSNKQKNVRLQRAKELKRRFSNGRHKDIVFSVYRRAVCKQFVMTVSGAEKDPFLDEIGGEYPNC